MASQSRKLSTEQVLEARLRYASGEREWSQFARDYGVDRTVIKRAVMGETFKELPMPPKRIFGSRPFPYG
ncbi:hypothetical protein HPT29_019455 [Microvirga terrae]|uniref:Uncharacterized protein n=1 Tax=Microvirga terrae TaxID=2740529 RepID=A0ABY5RP33_9HYPH|nr:MULTISPECIES: hypothetical protein [Microvirga]MBQ0822814.1 hypothetical protein [Microvirga sp. HBU67558]UVF18644.1 hypothetical protein HPT29_019455 [Microvirga terrae]